MLFQESAREVLSTKGDEGSPLGPSPMAPRSLQPPHNGGRSRKTNNKLFNGSVVIFIQ